MKTKVFLSALPLLCMLLLANLQAQPPRCPGQDGPPPNGVMPPPPPGQGDGLMPPPPNGKPFIPGLTKEQGDQLKTMETALMKKITPVEGKIGELEARLKSLISADSPDQKEILATVDQLIKLRGDIAKLHIEQHLAVQKILTEEQRLIFDRGFGAPPPPHVGGGAPPRGRM